MIEGAAVADRRVHPATVPLRFLKEAPQTLLGIPAAYAFISEHGLRQILFVVAGIALVAILYQWLSWRRFRYGIGEREIVIESGILSRTRRSIPFDRIQDVDIERGPLARLFGLAKLRIETGGSGKDEGVLDSVSLDEAERIRAALRGKRTDSAPEAEMPEQGRLIFRMSVGRVLLAGLFNFSLVYLAGLFGFLQTFEQWLPFDIYDPGRWVGLVGNRLQAGWSFGAIAAVALLALLLGTLLGIARTLSRDFGFRLTAEGAGFRRERGLFTRTEAMLPKRRIQLAVRQTGPLRRLLGWHALYLQTLAAEQGKGARQVAAPLARAAEIEAIIAEHDQIRLADPAALTLVSGRHLLRRLLSTSVPLLIILGAALVRIEALAALIFILPMLAADVLSWRHHRFGIRDGLVFVQRGVWRQRHYALPLRRIQSLRLSRSWLQRRLGLATLYLDTAGAPSLDPVRIEDLREARARELVTSLLAAPA